MDSSVAFRPEASAGAEAGPGAAPAIRCDVAIIGGGLAGSLAALVLGRQGLSPVVVDPHDPYPADASYETFSAAHVAQLDALGVLDVFRDLTGGDCGLLTTQGLRYDAMINALRRQWPDSVRLLRGKAGDLDTSGDRQTVTLSDGLSIDARLVVVATGTAAALGSRVTRSLLSSEHSVGISFTLAGAFGFDGLIHHGEQPGDGVGHARLFRLAATPHLMRVNLVLYDSPKSPRVRAFRLDPLGQLVKPMPGLRTRLLLAEPVGPVALRVCDLYEASGAPGMVLIGEARASSCPATGAATSRLLADVARLATRLPAWLEGEGMDPLYDDPGSRAEDAAHLRRAWHGRYLATQTGLKWRLLHLARKVRERVPGMLADPAMEMASRTDRDPLTVVPLAAVMSRLKRLATSS